MTDFKTLAQQRRGHRKFTNEEIDPEDLKEEAELRKNI